MNFGSWWWTVRPGVVRFMGSQRVGHDWATELNWIWLYVYIYEVLHFQEKSFTSINLHNYGIHLKIWLIFSSLKIIYEVSRERAWVSGYLKSPPVNFRTILRRWSINSYQEVHCLGSCYDHLLKKFFKDCVTSKFLLNFAFYNLSFFLMSNQIFSALLICCLCNTALKIWVGNVFFCSFCFISF